MFSLWKNKPKKIVQNEDKEAELKFKQRNTKTIRPKKKEQKISSIYPYSYKLLSKKIAFLFPRFYNIDKSLKVAMMPIPYEPYICAMVLFSLIGGVAGLAIGGAVSFFTDIKPDGFKILLPIILGVVLSQGTLGLMYQYPVIMIKARRSKINNELPYFIGYLATLATSALSLEEIFRITADEESDDELVKDSRHIMRNIDVLGMDIISGLKDLIERSPHEGYSELLEGLISTVQSGGNLREFFIAAAKVQLEEKKLNLRKMISSLGIIAEMYTVVLVVFPLMGIIILSIMAIMTPSLGGFNLTTLMYLLTFGFVPLLGTMMLFMIESMVPKR